MSKKIGRNDLCPCGSGKKFKNCHLNKEEALPTKRVSSSIDFKSLLRNHNSVQILKLLGALQLHPVNHGRNFRFEKLCRETLLQFNSDDTKPLTTWEKLKEIIERYTSGSHEEDSLKNAFTEIAIFEQGNYIVYPGIYGGFTQILNQLTRCIFLIENDLNNEFVNKIRNAVGLLLYMSDSAAHDAGHVAYIYQEGSTGNIEFPDYQKTIQYTKALFFPKEYLWEICEDLGYDMSILNDFLLHPRAEELQNDDPDQNVVNFKPIIERKDGFLLYMPTGIVNALVSYIYQKATEYHCFDELLDLFFVQQFYLGCKALVSTGWFATDIKLPTPNEPLPIQEKVFQFDNQKFGYVCFVQPNKIVQKDFTAGQPNNSRDPYEERTNQVIDYLKALNSAQPFGILCLYIVAEYGQDYSYSWAPVSSESNEDLALTYQELWTITHSANVNSLTLWKFPKCYRRTKELTRILSIGGLLDAFAIYRKNDGSLLQSDEANPFGGMYMIAPGNSDVFRRQVQKHQNEHAIPIFYNDRLRYAKVTRYKDYAPIYIEIEASKYFRIVIESYKMPVWVTNQQTTEREENWGTYTCEAIAFWLNKMAPFLSVYLNEQRLNLFEIEVIVPDEMLNPGQFEIKTVVIDDIQIKIEVTEHTIRVNIPFDFIYAVMLPDNRADKMLMNAVLTGIVNYILETGNNTILSSQTIDEIIDNTLRPAGAKMLLFSDTTLNIKIDDRNLPPLHYLHDSDISYILDNLVSYLPKGYIVPADIPDKKDKIKLCDDIVTALIAQITNKIAVFDGANLLNWLIKVNEKCIQVREFREIQIPAKIACFSDYETEVQQILDGEKNLVTTSHSVRTLIEFVTTKIPSGQKWPNFDDIEELLALTNQLTEWGALSEAMRMNLDNPEMGLLPSGRIGTEKSLDREALKPYTIARTETTLFKSVEDFESNYVPVRKTGNAIETEESKALDVAFKAEFGISLSFLSTSIGILVNEGFTKGVSCMEIEETELIKKLSVIEGTNIDDIKCLLNLLTLLERDSIGRPPAGYTSVDIFPWRFNRAISYIRRPLVKLHKEGNAYYYYGFRHLIQYIDHLFYLLYSSKLPDVKSDKMKSWLASASGDKGDPFRESVKKWFEVNSHFEVIPYEVRMEKGVSKGHITTDQHYGDIDLLVIDHTNRIIYPIECKNIHGGRNIHEMKVEMDDYLGRDGNDKKAKMNKHVKRDQWLKANKGSLIGLVPNAENYSIRSFILTADEVPLAYLKKGSLPLSLKSFAFLKKKGLSYLADV